jgi:hypothetical protein
VRGVQWGVTVATAILLAGLASGCDKVTGGGWIASFPNPLEKATFGFTAKCKNRTVNSTPTAVFYDGQLEYQDHGADIHIHGDVEPNEMLQVSDATCSEFRDFPIPALTMFEGRYRSQPDGGQGDFVVTVADNGEPGSLNGDMFMIVLTGTEEHTNSGPIQGGNIQVR